MTPPPSPSRRSILVGGTLAATLASTPSLRPTPTHAAPTHAAPTHAALTPLAAAEVPRHALWFTSPATDWESQALPIGNGRLGAMIFGGITEDHIQLNEISLWGGMNGYDNALAGQGDGAYDTHVTGFGSYRTFGDLDVSFGATGNARITATTTGTDSTSGETVSQSYDGNAATKWCLIAPNNGTTAWEVNWQAELGQAHQLITYTLTSANDVPERDPQDWVVEGSTDGTAWTTLDSRSHASTPFSSRGQQLTFTAAAPGSYQYFRFRFAPKVGVTHWQVADIGLPGVELGNSDTTPTDYRRSLDPNTGLHTVSFSQGSFSFVREAFATREGDILVFRYATDAPSGLNGTITVTSAQTGNTPGDTAADQPLIAPRYSVSNDGSHIWVNGQLGNQLRYAADVEVRTKGGTRSANPSTVSFAGCTELELRIDLRTDYRLLAAAQWRSGADPAALAATTLSNVAGQDFATLQHNHVASFTAITGRVAVAWGTTADDIAALPTDARRARYAANADNSDPELEVMMFLWSRYLLISSSRSDGLPANLQGLWNNQNQPAWASDYHTNINLQMNYWGAEVTDLPDSHVALINYIDQVREPSRIATRQAFGQATRGWTARTSQSAFGGNAWEWNTVASAWYMHHVSEHWAFHPADRAYLERAYPMVKEICEFWQDRLIEKTLDGKAVLVAPMGWSPEHGPREDGVMYDQQIIWDLFTNYLELAAALGVDASYQTTVATMRDRLAPNKIGSWGQLQEWLEDIDDPADLHRHTSHLFAVYPGRQITHTAHADLSAAALKSLNARCGVPNGEPIGIDTVSGDSRRSWTWPWRAALFARLAEPERAYQMLRGLLTHNTLTNMFTTHPPFQIDGNLGISGGIAEMLVQSHEGFIHIAPALPQRWQAAGSFSGLRARGGFRVSARWENGRVTWYEVVPDRASATAVRIKVNGTVVDQN